MSIDAIINRVRETDDGYELELIGRLTRQEPAGNLVDTPPGQSKLTIVDPTWKPPVGVAIWGGSGSVIIETRPRREYERIGYTRLRERKRE